MVKKMHATGSKSDTQADAKLAGTVKESASQIWLAGLGAFSKAQEEGSKVFDALVREGLSIQRKTQAAAEEKISEASNKMASMATDISSKASGQWDKLETIFEERVSRAMKKLGVPTAREIDALAARVDELNRSVARLAAAKGGARAAKAAKSAKSTRTSSAGGATRPAAKKRAAKKAA